MRRILTGFAVAAAVAAIATLALAGNQDVADQVAQELRASGQMSGYKIGVKCQNGTVWLRGSVANEEQMNAALKLAFQTPGVARVVNELNIAPAAAAQPARAKRRSRHPNPMRGNAARRPRLRAATRFEARASSR